MLIDQRRICVSICERDVSALPSVFSLACEEGDYVELRLDAFGERDLPSAVPELHALLKTASVPTIITLRPKEQGGRRPITLPERLQFWHQHGFGLPATFFDLEVDLAEHLMALPNGVEWPRVICSFHEFKAPVRDVTGMYERLTRTPARVLKVAVAVEDASEIAEIFALLERAKSEQRELIVIGMGTAGIATRLLGPSRGSFLTYATLNRAGATAPGQPTISDLRKLYRVDRIDEVTQVMGLIGNPISHSLSPQVHNAAFGSQGINAVYIPFEVRDLNAFIRRVVMPATREIPWNLAGLSVTAPHKQTVMNHLNWVEPSALEVGAVNTIVITDAGLRGYNTDTYGFISPLKKELGDLRNASCAVIGSGGVARAATWALLKEGATVTIFARNLARANDVASKFGVKVSQLKDASFSAFDTVINATVLGMAGEHEEHSPASAEQLAGARLAYDLVYNPVETRFLQESKKAGCDTIGGLPMFVAQAAEQFRLWTGRDAPEQVMHQAALAGLGKSL